jgi:hypothetical protein
MTDEGVSKVQEGCHCGLDPQSPDNKSLFSGDSASGAE